MPCTLCHNYLLTQSASRTEKRKRVRKKGKMKGQEEHCAMNQGKRVQFCLLLLFPFFPASFTGACIYFVLLCKSREGMKGVRGKG